jgi:alanine dehydrogenase
MLIGVPKEIKNNEYRVGMTPASVREVIHSGHSVIVETMAGSGIGSGDDDYIAAGADVVNSAAEVFSRAEMIVKVKNLKHQSVTCCALSSYSSLTFILLQMRFKQPT